ncbi:RNA polymerase-associated protein Leo1p [[Candida] railenensis]|uniref:RNA polymerase-associated protein Leo1p n=1 Tax=[Candida] railenensis TaxID=45579 RepID=A0A9P0QMJ0_9ASCO|nr:RNA polymerase-associated protein Leo1p [[Candida] railenensis]
MSEEEARSPSRDEDDIIGEEVDDLFGDDEDEDQQPREVNGGDDSQESDEEEEVDEAELKAIDVSLPRHAISNKTEENVYNIKMPVFLNVEAAPFDPTEFKAQVKQSAENRSKLEMSAKQLNDDLVAEGVLNENTIRWRYSNQNDDIIKQSNAHFVQWDDGSLSVKIGSEMFDFRELPNADSILVRSHDQLEFLQSDSIINKLSNLVPTSTNSATHRKLTQAVKNIQKKVKILNTLTERDPLSKQREADENERKLSKMKRQLEAKRRLQEERLERNSPSLAGNGPGGRYDSEPAYERFEKTYGYEDEDEDDGFIDNDEEEEEVEEDEEEEEEEEDEDAAAERLRKLKSAGAEKYSKRNVEEEEDKTRKKRRIIDSDEEE